jgi:hypothetical protein
MIIMIIIMIVIIMIMRTDLIIISTIITLAASSLSRWKMNCMARGMTPRSDDAPVGALSTS